MTWIEGGANDRVFNAGKVRLHARAVLWATDLCRFPSLESPGKIFVGSGPRVLPVFRSAGDIGRVSRLSGMAPGDPSTPKDRCKVTSWPNSEGKTQGAKRHFTFEPRAADSQSSPSSSSSDGWIKRRRPAKRARRVRSAERSKVGRASDDSQSENDGPRTMAPRVHGHCRADIDCDQKIQAKRSGVDVAQRGRTPSSFRDKAGNFFKRGPYSGQCGLSNEGNTCFINSALQCLAHTRGLVAYLTSCGYKRDMCVSNPLGSGGELLRVFAPLIQGIWAGQNSRMSTFHLKQAVSSHAPRFSGYRQHDAQEFLAYMLDALHEDLKRRARSTLPLEPRNPTKKLQAHAPSVRRSRCHKWPPEHGATTGVPTTPASCHYSMGYRGPPCAVSRADMRL